MTRFAPTPLACAAILAGALCLPLHAAPAPEPSFAELVDKVALVPAGGQQTEVQAKVSEAAAHLKRMALPKAQQAINEALQLDARNPHLHLLNGFVYHLQARQGDTQKTEMAIEGYQQALRLDPSHWIAQEFLGLAYVDLQQFARAKAEFAGVLLLTPDSRTSQFGLMVASYLTGDARTACAMADQFQTSPGDAPRSFVRSSVAVYAACGNFAQADRARAKLAVIDGDSPDLQRVERRLEQWKAFYNRRDTAPAQMVQTQAFALPPLPPRAASAAQEPTAIATAAPATTAARVEPAVDGPRMLLVDVVLLSTQEVAGTSKGVNLLSALTLQLGSVAGNLAAFSRVNTWNLAASGADPATSTAITRAVTIPALTYSLNIANANNSFNEVLARPTLAAIEGQPSEFFSGTNLSAGLVSTSTQGGTTVVPLEKKFGIKLAVTPTFLSRGRVQLKVDAQRTSLDASVENPKAAYQIQIGETTSNANVVMNLGDTLILSGLSEKSSTSTRDGVPGLQDVPVVQYLFSNKKTHDVHRSVLVLVTPRAAVQVAQDPAAASDDGVARMRELRERFGLAARVPANVEAVLQQMQPDELFRQFRQGDVSMERWDRSRVTAERVKEAFGFFYY
jgi:pilus assembly protein CpaC